MEGLVWIGRGASPMRVMLRRERLWLSAGERARTVAAEDLGGARPIGLASSADWLGLVCSDGGVWRLPVEGFERAPLERLFVFGEVRVEEDADEDDESQERGELLRSVEGRLYAWPGAPWVVRALRVDRFERVHIDRPGEVVQVAAAGFYLPTGAWEVSLGLRPNPLTAILSTPNPRQHNNEPGGLYVAELEGPAPRFRCLEDSVYASAFAKSAPWVAWGASADYINPNTPNIHAWSFASLPDGEARVIVDLQADTRAALEPYAQSALRFEGFSEDAGTCLLSVLWGGVWLIVDLEREQHGYVVQGDARGDVSGDPASGTVTVGYAECVLIYSRHGVARLDHPSGAVRVLADGEHALILGEGGLWLRALTCPETIHSWPDRRAFPEGVALSVEAEELVFVDGDAVEVVDLSGRLVPARRPAVVEGAGLPEGLERRLLLQWLGEDTWEDAVTALLVSEAALAGAWRAHLGARFASFPLFAHRLDEAKRVLAHLGLDHDDDEAVLEVAARVAATAVVEDWTPRERGEHLGALLEGLLDGVAPPDPAALLKLLGVDIDEGEAAGEGPDAPAPESSLDDGARPAIDEEDTARCLLGQLRHRGALQLAEAAAPEPLYPLLVAALFGDGPLAARRARLREALEASSAVLRVEIEDDALQWSLLRWAPRADNARWWAAELVQRGLVVLHDDAALESFAGLTYALLYGEDEAAARVSAFLDGLDASSEVRYHSLHSVRVGRWLGL